MLCLEKHPRTEGDPFHKREKPVVFYAILAAALYAVNIPLSKIPLNHVQPTMMAAFLYPGAGLGLFLYGLLTGKKEKGIR